MDFNFDEINDGLHFQELIISYFENLKEEGDKNIKDIVIVPSGDGNDEGCDILVTFLVTDAIATIESRWVIQAKFHDRSISPKLINDVNIPTLLYSYKANGYLLICKKRPTSKLTKLFQRLGNECIYGNRYIIWTGEQFKRSIIDKGNILKQFFPLYYEYNLKLNKK